MISSLSSEQPNWIVAKFIIDSNLFKKEGNCFDSRGVYLVCTETYNYIWVGSDINEVTRDKYIKKASKHIE